MPTLRVGDIEDMLLKAFPASWAADGDRLGLFTGDRSAPVGKVAVALDSSVATIEAASAAGCDMLVTHHPPFWDAPMRFTAAESAGLVDGAAVYAAVRRGIALLAMHTNVDCAPAAYNLLLLMLGLEYTGPLQPEVSRLGQLARPRDGGSIRLEVFASGCEQAFGRVYSVWGEPEMPLSRLAVCSGGASEVLPAVLKARPDCFVTGELPHHEHIYLADAGIALVELGHDLSELPYRWLLSDALVEAGLSEEQVVVLAPTAAWWTPEGRRMAALAGQEPYRPDSYPVRKYRR